jgi:two-component system OmpR family sensor kinase
MSEMHSTSKPLPPARPEERRARPVSLRLRLSIWYGTLLAAAFVVFATLVVLLATDQIAQSVDNAVRAESRTALVDTRQALLPDPPYWPAHLALPAVDTVGDPGVAVEVLDAQGGVRYRSASSASMSLRASPEQLRAALAGQEVWYTTSTDGERMRVEALPVRAPTPAAPVIGVQLVGKSLGDVETALALLRTLIIVIGLASLAAALLGGWAIAARVLSPLGEIGATARRIAAATSRGTGLGGLSQRVRRPAGHDELAQLVDTFNEMLAALDRATQIQRRFVADASHELRAPLTTVQGNLAFLQRHLDDLPPEERRTMLADAHTETLRLARLVDDLLLLARSDASADAVTAANGAPAAGSIRASRRAEQPVELDRAIVQLVRQLRGRLRVEGSALAIEIGHIEPARVYGDEEALRRIALILLDNAIKYTPAPNGAPPGPVVVSLEHADAEAVLRVRDHGIGIEPADLPHIFERFYRSDRARGRQGTGLGLAIAQTLAERMGGRITAESVPGQGSTFSVWLPLAPDDAPAAPRSGPSRAAK